MSRKRARPTRKKPAEAPELAPIEAGLLHAIRRDPLALGLVVGLPTLVYALMACRTVYVGDSGELITAAATLGLAHPTGYPVYLIAGKIWCTLLFFLEPAVAMNLLSSIAGGLTAGTAFLIARSLGAGRWSAAATAVLLATSTSFWSQATVARVYTPNLFLMGMSLFYAAETARARLPVGPEFGRRDLLSLSVLWSGLAMGVHTVSALLAFAILPLWLSGAFDMRARLRAALAVLPGALAYLYIPIASAFGPAQNWGNPSTWDKLVRYLKREEYWQRRFYEEAGDALEVILHYLERMPIELTWVGVGLVVFGLWVGARRHRRALAVALVIGAANVGLMIWHGSRNDIFHWDRYVLPMIGAAILIAGLGMAWLEELLRARGPRLPALLLLPALLPLGQNWAAMDRSAHTLAADINFRILNNMPQGAVLIADGDNILFPQSYLHNALDMRPDVTLVLQGINELSQMEIRPDEQPVFFTHPFDLKNDQVRLVPRGLVFQLVTDPEAKLPPVDWDDWVVPSFEDPSGQGELDFLSRSLIGDYFLNKAHSFETSDPPEALAAARRNLESAHDNPNNVVNSGLVLERLGLMREALRAFERVLTLDPRDEVAPRHIRKLARFQQGVSSQRLVDRALQNSVRLYQGGDLQGAIGSLLGANAREPTADRITYNLAALFIQAGNYAQASRWLLRTLDLDPDDSVAKRDLRMVRQRMSGQP